MIHRYPQYVQFPSTQALYLSKSHQPHPSSGARLRLRWWVLGGRCNGTFAISERSYMQRQGSEGGEHPRRHRSLLKPPADPRWHPQQWDPPRRNTAPLAVAATSPTAMGDPRAAK